MFSLPGMGASVLISWLVSPDKTTSVTDCQCEDVLSGDSSSGGVARVIPAAGIVGAVRVCGGRTVGGCATGVRTGFR